MSDKVVVLFADGPDAVSALEQEIARRGLEVLAKEEQSAFSLETGSDVFRQKWTCANPADIAD
ncbi:hypothetical protein [Rhizobium leguminosarum]